MSNYTLVNLKDVKDMAPDGGMSPGMEARFARGALEMENGGLSFFRIAADYRVPFGHSHSEQEEVYLVLSGSVRAKLDDDLHEMVQWDTVRIGPGVMRALEGGPEGGEVLAFGAPNTDNKDIDMVPGWWAD
jgi:quercetin dioxygenase-like cupin family protein